MQKTGLALRYLPFSRFSAMQNAIKDEGVMTGKYDGIRMSKDEGWMMNDSGRVGEGRKVYRMQW